MLGSANTCIKLSIPNPIVKEPSIGITLIDHCLIHREWISYLILVIEDSGIVVASIFFILKAILTTHTNSVLLTLITVKILIIKLSNQKMTLADVLRFILKDG